MAGLHSFFVLNLLRSKISWKSSFYVENNFGHLKALIQKLLQSETSLEKNFGLSEQWNLIYHGQALMHEKLQKFHPFPGPRTMKTVRRYPRKVLSPLFNILHHRLENIFPWSVQVEKELNHNMQIAWYLVSFSFCSFPFACPVPRKRFLLISFECVFSWCNGICFA